MVRFLVHFTASRTPGTEEEADEFCENFLGFLLNLATAKDRAIRFRVCQLVAGVLNALGVEAEISDDLYERMEDVMLDRLRDKVPVVRAQAARALSRLQDGGEDGNFSDDVAVVGNGPLGGGGQRAAINTCDVVVRRVCGSYGRP